MAVSTIFVVMLVMAALMIPIVFITAMLKKAWQQWVMVGIAATMFVIEMMLSLYLYRVVYIALKGAGL